MRSLNSTANLHQTRLTKVLASKSMADSNNDNLINTNDSVILQPSFGRTVGNRRYDDRAEFTGDDGATELR